VKAWRKLTLVLCLAAGWPAPARANGRFPAANSIVFAPDHGGRFVVRTTFGLLEVRELGEAPTWTCEQALGFASDEDPLLVITDSGTRVVATSFGAVRSTDACSFAAVAGLDDRLIMDLALDADRGRVLALGVEVRDDGTTRSRIYASNDEGQSFQPLGEPFPEGVLPITLDAARSDGDRIYVSARIKTDSGYSGVFYASDDGGLSFAEFPVTETDSTRLPFIAAVSPTDPDRVYVRVNDPDGSVLWATENGGESLERIAQGAGALLGFAVSPDGSQIAFGGPEDGVSVAAADGSDAVRVNDLPATCLGWSEAGLYACGSTSGDAIVFHSADAGRSFDGVFGKAQLAGETGCAEDTPVGAVCRPAWSAVAPLLAPPDVPSPDPGEGGEGGMPQPPPAEEQPERREGCSFGSASGDRGAVWLLSLALALAARRLRNRRS
jgi:hypothetical protein